MDRKTVFECKRQVLFSVDCWAEDITQSQYQGTFVKLIAIIHSCTHGDIDYRSGFGKKESYFHPDIGFGHQNVVTTQANRQESAEASPALKTCLRHNRERKSEATHYKVRRIAVNTESKHMLSGKDPILVEANEPGIAQEGLKPGSIRCLL